MKLLKRKLVYGARKGSDPQHEELIAALYDDREYIIEQIESIIGYGDIIENILASQYDLSIYLKPMGDIKVRGVTLVYDNDNLKRFQSYDELLDFVIHRGISTIKERYQKLLDIYNRSQKYRGYVISDYGRIQRSDGFIDVDFAQQFDGRMYNVATAVNCKFEIYYEADKIMMLCTTAKDLVFDINLYDISSETSIIREVDNHIHDQEYFDSRDHNRGDMLEVLYTIRDNI